MSIIVYYLDALHGYVQYVDISHISSIKLTIPPVQGYSPVLKYYGNEEGKGRCSLIHYITQSKAHSDSGVNCTPIPEQGAHFCPDGGEEKTQVNPKLWQAISFKLEEVDMAQKRVNDAGILLRERGNNQLY